MMSTKKMDLKKLDTSLYSNGSQTNLPTPYNKKKCVASEKTQRNHQINSISHWRHGINWFMDIDCANFSCNFIFPSFYLAWHFPCWTKNYSTKDFMGRKKKFVQDISPLRHICVKQHLWIFVLNWNSIKSKFYLLICMEYDCCLDGIFNVCCALIAVKSENERTSVWGIGKQIQISYCLNCKKLLSLYFIQ